MFVSQSSEASAVTAVWSAVWSIVLKNLVRSWYATYVGGARAGCSCCLHIIVLPNYRKQYIGSQQYTHTQCPSWFLLLERYKFCGQRQQWDKEKLIATAPAGVSCVCSSHSTVLPTRRHPAHAVSLPVLPPRDTHNTHGCDWMPWLVKVLGWFGQRGVLSMGGAYFKTRAPGCAYNFSHTRKGRN